MQKNPPPSVLLNNQKFTIIKPTRLREGMVVRRGNIYGRVGPRHCTRAQQRHTELLAQQGFPVPTVLESGPCNTTDWFFTESSLGRLTFHDQFSADMRRFGHISSSVFERYLSIIRQYLQAQLSINNHRQATPDSFVSTMIPDDLILSNYQYFSHDIVSYKQAIDRAKKRLSTSKMGILQFDLNPYNILPKGIIDFELVGNGPVGYDVLMSARWGGTWFPNYPSRYPSAYSLSKEQIEQNDTLVATLASDSSVPNPLDFLEEFLLLKTAWTFLEPVLVQSDWPQDKIAFHRFRANLLQRSVNHYLAGKPIDYWNFSSLPGAELRQGA